MYEWTIMLYMSGDNNLSDEMVRALNDIAAEGGPKEVAFTIQYDPRSPGFATCRYAVTEERRARRRRWARDQAGDGPLPIPDFLVKRLTVEDSADPRVLASFIQWSAKQYPSRRRMLILSGHGSGAVGDFLSDEHARRGRPSSLTIPHLARALRRARRRIHVLGMDSCLMGMAEVCHEVRGQVEYLVGSEGYLPNTGWPYAHLLKQLRKRQPEEMTPENLAKWTVADVLSYYDQCIPAWVSVDMAACRLDRLPALAKRVKRLTASLRDRNEHSLSPLSQRVRDSVIVAHWRAQSYKFEQYTDLWDFCDQLEDAAHLNGSSRTLRNLERACREVKAALEAVVVLNGHRGAEFQHSHGLSVYFPWSPSLNERDDALADYRRMGFPRESGWNAFLKFYLKRTQREMREEKGNRGGGRVRLSAFGTPEADSANKASERVNKASERVNKASERVNKFGDLIMRIYAGPGMAVPWSMKNPPRSGWWTKPVAHA